MSLGLLAGELPATPALGALVVDSATSGGVLLVNQLIDIHSCNVSAKMEHAGIAHGTTVGLVSVPILPRLLHKHLLLRVIRPGQPCFLIRSRTATIVVCI